MLETHTHTGVMKNMCKKYSLINHCQSIIAFDFLFANKNRRFNRRFFIIICGNQPGKCHRNRPFSVHRHHSATHQSLFPIVSF